MRRGRFYGGVRANPGRRVPSNYAFERTGSLSSRARVRRARHIAPATRLKARQPAAQRER